MAVYVGTKSHFQSLANNCSSNRRVSFVNLYFLISHFPQHEEEGGWKTGYGPRQPRCAPAAGDGGGQTVPTVPTITVQSAALGGLSSSKLLALPRPPPCRIASTPRWAHTGRGTL